MRLYPQPLGRTGSDQYDGVHASAHMIKAIADIHLKRQRPYNRALFAATAAHTSISRAWAPSVQHSEEVVTLLAVIVTSAPDSKELLNSPGTPTW
jgi:hypothetical protein